jgi:hypothetical protein
MGEDDVYPLVKRLHEQGWMGFTLNRISAYELRAIRRFVRKTFPGCYLSTLRYSEDLDFPLGLADACHAQLWLPPGSDPEALWEFTKTLPPRSRVFRLNSINDDIRKALEKVNHDFIHYVEDGDDFWHEGMLVSMEDDHALAVQIILMAA